MGSQRFQSKSFMISFILLIALSIMGYMQFRSIRYSQHLRSSSTALSERLSEMLRDIEELKSSHLEYLQSPTPLFICKYLVKKEEILEQLASIQDLEHEEEAIIQKKEKLSALLKELFRKIDVSLIGAQALGSNGSSASQLGERINFVPLVVFIANWNQVQSEILKETVFTSELELEIYILVIFLLLIASLILAIIYNRKIKVELLARDEAEHQNQIHHEIFEYAEQLSGTGHGVFDYQSKKMTFSDHQYTILGYSRSEITPSLKAYFKCIQPQDRERVFLHLKTISTNDPAIKMTIKIITKTGEEKTLQLIAKKREWSDRNVLIFVNKDITEEVKIQERLKQLNKNLNLQIKLFRHAEQIANMGYYFHDLGTGEIGFSKHLFRLLDLEPSPGTASAHALIQAIHKDDREKIRIGLDPSNPLAPLDSEPVRIINSQNGLKFLQFSKELFEEEDTKILLVTIKEVTWETLTRSQLLQQNEELHKFNTELASFNHIASHDLQEPTRKIQTFISMLKRLDVIQGSERAMDLFNRVQKSANRMQNLIMDLLKFTGIANAEKMFEKACLQDLLENALDELALVIEEKNAKIIVPSLPDAFVIPYQVQQLFFNLISNSLKFSSADRHPVITIEKEALTKVDMEHFPIYEPNQLLKITISDNGLGFDPDQTEYMFMLFRKLHEKAEFTGTGVGLSFSKKIIENHKGVIFADGSPGQGAVITFILPILP
jgi:PAS domain S-box-containing protein